MKTIALVYRLYWVLYMYTNEYFHMTHDRRKSGLLPMNEKLSALNINFKVILFLILIWDDYMYTCTKELI